ncbi:hypothetical protein DNTS_003319 [Danionella cerebrum]|uniref:Uncharacterized protein n=1 Tax=Danionella cerebrum TaxID=2873325 RepID=A0A553MVQ9_9TELE|nr:hypothetical protein DNTS_003319 [Danionella translucida]
MYETSMYSLRLGQRTQGSAEAPAYKGQVSSIEAGVRLLSLGNGGGMRDGKIRLLFIKLCLAEVLTPTGEKPVRSSLSARPLKSIPCSTETTVLLFASLQLNNCSSRLCSAASITDGPASAQSKLSLCYYLPIAPVNGGEEGMGSQSVIAQPLSSSTQQTLQKIHDLSAGIQLWRELQKALGTRKENQNQMVRSQSKYAVARARSFCRSGSGGTRNREYVTAVCVLEKIQQKHQDQIQGVPETFLHLFSGTNVTRNSSFSPRVEARTHQTQVLLVLEGTLQLRKPGGAVEGQDVALPLEEHLLQRQSRIERKQSVPEPIPVEPHERKEPAERKLRIFSFLSLLLLLIFMAYTSPVHLSFTTCTSEERPLPTVPLTSKSFFPGRSSCTSSSTSASETHVMNTHGREAGERPSDPLCSGRSSPESSPGPDKMLKSAWLQVCLSHLQQVIESRGASRDGLQS